MLCSIVGICIKTFKTDDQSKVFINLCHHADIPAPENITRDELVEILSSKDPEKFCVPLSIGTEHEELDKGEFLVLMVLLLHNLCLNKLISLHKLFKSYWLLVGSE